MRQYEVTFIVDPVLSNDEIQSTAQNYNEHLKGEGCEIVHIDEMGLRQLAYTIKKRNSGVYYCIEFKSDDPEIIGKIELALRRDERIIRFLTVSLDKYGVKYNDDKRNGRIGKKKEKATSDKDEDQPAAKKDSGPKQEPKAEAKAEPKAEPKSEPKAEAKDEPKAEAKAEPKAETKAEPAAEASAAAVATATEEEE